MYNIFDTSLKRSFDLLFSFFLLVVLFPLFLLISFLIKISSEGDILYWSKRVGRHNTLFDMPKFRTMTVEAPVIATHLFSDSSSYLTKYGSILRKTSLDELPQLWNILIGDMSFVGPRPALYNQYDLIELRAKFDLDKLLPGLTGWAQINGRDDLTINEKIYFDYEYYLNYSFLFDLKILLFTILKVLKRSNISN